MGVASTFHRHSRLAHVFGTLFLLAQTICVASAQQQDQQQSQTQSQSQSQSPSESRSQQQPPTAASPTQNPATPTDPSQQAEPAAKKHKVWTNDDAIESRTPADNYQFEKEAQEAADKEAAAKKAAAKAAAKSEKEPPLDIKLPATQEETETMLKDTQGQIDEETKLRDRLQNEYSNTPLDQQPQKQQEIDRANRIISNSQRDLKALQDHLLALREKSQPENPSVPAPPPSF